MFTWFRKRIRREKIPAIAVQNKPVIDSTVPDRPIMPEQALLLANAHIYFNERFENVWSLDFFQFMVLAYDDLQDNEDAKLLIETLEPFNKISGEKLLKQWQKVADEKYRENLVDNVPPYHFNGRGMTIGRKILKRDWDDVFSPEVKECFTEKLIEKLKKIREYYSNKCEIFSEYEDRFLSQEI